MNYNRNLKLRENSRSLRKAGNLSEVLLWKQIKGKQLGVGFLRQAIVGNYIVDFYSPMIKTVVEIDGASHNEKAEYDLERDNYLKSVGLTVLHIADVDVKKNLEGVVSLLKTEIEKFMRE